MATRADTLIADDLPLTFRELKASLRSPYRTISNVRVRDRWESHHARFLRLRLEHSKPQSKQVTVKRFTGAPSDDELAYRYQHDSARLYHSEKTNLDLISQFVSQDLVPQFYGAHDAQKVIFMEYLKENSLSSSLIAVANVQRGSGFSAEVAIQKRQLLMGGIKNLARFVGECNAEEDTLNRLGNYKADFDARRSGRETEAEDLFKTYLTRICYALDPSLTLGEPYRSSKIISQLRETGQIDLEEAVRNIFVLKTALNERAWLQHGDYNVAHMFGNKVVDLEDFGYGSWTRDLSTFFMGGIDNISVPEGKELPQFIALFLAYKHAFQTGSQQLCDDLDGIMSSGDLSRLNCSYLEQIKAIEDQRAYADFVFGFFASAIEEGVHLDATLRRYTPDHLQQLVDGLVGYTPTQMLDCKRKYTEELFKVVEDISPLTRLCTHPEGVRDYFATLGQVLTTLKAVNLDPSCLSRIRNPNDTAAAVYDSFLASSALSLP
ncbi:MAG: hypothetical protein WCV90_00450 [Candidatus Woesearchaeota archaeon]